MSGTAYPVETAAPTALPRSGFMIVTGILAAAILALLWFGVATGTLPAAVDAGFDAWIVAVRSPGLVIAAIVVTELGQPAVMITLSVVVVAALAWRSRTWSPVFVGAGALGLLGLFDNVVKRVVARPRPPSAWQAWSANGPSFPSGHALWSVGVLLLLVVLVRPIRRQWILGLSAVVVCVLVAGSRLILAVHYPSDVFAGWSLAVLADAIVLVVSSAIFRRRAAMGERASSSSP